jgi:hypothetical protein
LRAVLVVYVAAIALLPLSHHDLACHLKTSTHCVACVVGSAGETPDDLGPVKTTVLADAGQLVCDISAPASAGTQRGTAGRSPPSQS